MSEASNAYWSGGVGGAASGASTGAQIGGPWGAVIGGVIGGGMGLLGAKNWRKNSAQGKEDEIMKLERERREKIEALRDAEEKRVGPLRDSLYADASSDQPLDYASTQADLRRRYQDALRGIRSQRTDSGLAASQEQAANLDLASQLSGAYDQGLKNRRALRMGLYQQSPINQLNWQAATSGDRMAEMLNQQRIENMKAQAASKHGMFGGLGSLGSMMGQGGGMGGMFGGAGGGASTSTSYQSPQLQGLGGLGQMGGGSMPGGSPNYSGGMSFGG